MKSPSLLLVSLIWLLVLTAGGTQLSAQQQTKQGIDWQKTDFSSPTIKQPFFTKKKKTWPWIVGGAVAAGTIVVLALPEDQNQPAPEPLKANDDNLTVDCGGSSSVNVLTNDTGEGLVITSYGPVSGAIVTQSSNGVFLISNPSTASISFPYSIRDASGGSASANVHVTVKDNNPAGISCPPNITLSCSASTAPSSAGNATVTNDCASDATLLYNDDLNGLNGCNQTGTFLRTWTVTDNDQSTATCVQNITIQDVTPPYWAFCPINLTVFCGQQNDLNITGQAVAGDSCGTVQALPYSDDLTNLAGCEGYIIRTWQAEDACGNNATPCVQTIGVQPTPCGFVIFATAVPIACPTPGDIMLTIVGLSSDSLFTVVVNGPVNITIPDQLPGIVTIGDFTNLDPGTYIITVLNAMGCQEITSVIVPYIPPFQLEAVMITPPSCPTCTDGSVVFQVGPGAVLPVVLRIDGSPAGTFNSSSITLNNIGPGVYAFDVVDNNGMGCASNLLVLVFNPMAPPNRNPTWQMGLRQSWPTILSTRAISEALLQKLPEHPDFEEATTPIHWAPVQTLFGVSVPVFKQFSASWSYAACRGTGSLSVNGEQHITAFRSEQHALGMRWSPASKVMAPFIESRLVRTGLEARLHTAAASYGVHTYTYGVVMEQGVSWKLFDRFQLELSTGLFFENGRWHTVPGLYFGIR